MSTENIKQAHHALENALEIFQRPTSTQAVDQAWGMVAQAKDLLAPVALTMPAANSAGILIENALEVHSSGATGMNGQDAGDGVQESLGFVQQAYEQLTNALKATAGASPFTRPKTRDLTPPAFKTPSQATVNVLDVEKCAREIFVRSQGANSPDVSSAEASFTKAVAFAQAVLKWREAMARANAAMDTALVESIAYEIYVHVQTANVPHTSDPNACIEKAVSFVRTHIAYRQRVEMGMHGMPGPGGF